MRRRAYPAASPAMARAMCVVMRGNWNSRESFTKDVIYFRRVQEHHFSQSDRILNIFTEATRQAQNSFERSLDLFFGG